MKFSTLILSSLTSLLLADSALSQETKDQKPEQTEKTETPTVTIEEKALDFEVKFEAVVLPKAVQGTIFQPKVWGSFPVIEALPHGSPVTKGESVIKVDTESLEKAIIDQEAEVESSKLNLAATKTSFERLKRDQKLARENSQRYLDRLHADHKHYLEVTVPMEKNDSEFNLNQRERRLEAEMEELRQLTAMYQEDELTEETEEIILKRAKASVADAKYLLNRAKIVAAKDLEIDLLREIENFQLKVEKAKREAADQEQDRQVELKRKEMQLASAQRSYNRAAEKLQGMRSDLEMAKFPADKAGFVFYGIVEAGGQWNFAETSKRLSRGGTLAARKPLFTIIPENAQYILSATVNPEQLEQLKFAKTGYATLGDTPTLRSAVTLSPVPEKPMMNGHFPITLDIEPADFLNPSSKLTVNLTGNSDKKGPCVPKSAVKCEDDGSFSVMIKTDDESFEQRSISIELENKSSFLISEGLKAGDIVKKSAE